ncbi:carboxypeptidase M32 [Sneathiella marina]|uniref:Metal-dependent carboxypeptidase n=1 Tax=Sneathiella marina TaxID=2950108 RepID=A0ABY4W585_9PROT|nr:carboxypeptidase M32 [Sneathiella marina]USG62167.1 carboxypeptidase M32 [Sneathiella marina]
MAISERAMSAYDQLELKFSRQSALSGAMAMLHWDSAVIMPDGGSGARANQLATLGVLAHDLLTDPGIGDLLDEAEADRGGLNDWQQANLREMRNGWRHATAVDADLVEAHSHATSACEMRWRAAREENDFASLIPSLEEVVDLTRQIAVAKSEAFQVSPYDALLDQYEPGCVSATIDTLFNDLGAFLPDFLQHVLERQKSQPDLILPAGPFAIETQKQVGHDFMEALGFNFDHGRLDISHHPFTGGIPDDVRLTTRYVTEDFTQSLMGTLHETGHALYEQGLPAAWRSQPVGLARGMALHESQSLLVEMQLSRGEDFLSYALPKMKSAYQGSGAAWDLQNLQQLYLNVKPDMIRVDADEVTYPLHVILRYRLEKALLSGDLAIAELPGAWNEQMQTLLGVTPPTDSMGCLQDIHWPSGAIGYFPTYTMGALAAAQIFQAAFDNVENLQAQIRVGRFDGLVTWLRQNIHEVGSSKSTNEILQAATGYALHTDAFKAHLNARYLPS